MSVLDNIFGGGPSPSSSLAPKTSKRPPRMPTYAETQANESAADQGGGQDNNPNNIASDFQPPSRLECPAVLWGPTYL